MELILEGFYKAITLLVTLDPEVLNITLLPLLAGVMAGFGGVISEGGASIMVGGNSLMRIQQRDRPR